MATARLRAIPRPVSVIAIAVIVAACVTPSSPSEGAATSASAVPPPSASDASTPTGPTATSSPASPADAFEEIPSTEGALNAIWAADGTIVVGGFVGPVFTSTILVFDGRSWSVAEVPVAPGQVTGIAKLGDKWIAVGNGLPDVRSGFIWDSVDGRTWRLVQTMENAALYDVTATDTAVLAAGARLDAEMNATASAWSSTDGTTWEQATVEGSAGASMGSIATTPGGFAATGDRPLGAARPFWTATTAASWAALENDLNDQLLPSDIVAWGEQYALVGASGKSGDQHPFVAFSTDGRAWKRTNFSTNEGYASAVTVANEQLVVAGIDADRLTLWSLSDGVWTTNTYEPSGASISALTRDSDLGLVAVGARDGRHAVWLFGGQ